MDKLIQEYINKTHIQPRPYQIRVISNTLKAFIEDKLESILIESPCGSGKTVMGLLVARILQDLLQVNVGWVAMRRNLLAQAQAENENKLINANINYISMFEKNPPTDVDMLVIDEGHHDATDSCVHLHNIIQPQYVLALSATPWRADRAKLCFNKIIKDEGVKRLITDGFLSQFNHYTIPQWNVSDVCNTYMKFPWGKSILYFHNLAQCYEAWDILNRNGVACEVIAGHTNRERQLREFSEGKLSVLINCMVLTEGFDAPDLETVFVRPSHKGCTMQMCGRVLRKYEGIPFKKIVQCSNTPWPYTKTASPHASFLLQDNEWRQIEAKTEKISAAYDNTIKSIAKIDIRLPKNLQKDGKRRRRFV